MEAISHENQNQKRFFFSFDHSILLPGGGTWFNQSHGYAVAGTHIYSIAQQMNDNGIYFPLFGTCLGFELLVYNSNQNQEYRTVCSSQRQSLPLEFTDGNRTLCVLNVDRLY